ncbi:hypothetical protein [Brevibacillus centrosporus]|uniref:Secreted protein n=1 Tax=Brevibacillus centrosporus TaxID=54910 RepID=A0A1I3V7S0_9BACL|nr:hypothetical protein [Brevibacillus centrosporus]SFJ91200.1 hypothetical protein SAMN05518846_106264 [Brevibacillus centrosporus]
MGVLAGSALMYNNSVYHSVSAAFGQGAAKNSVAQAGGDLSGSDLEAALQAVQNSRANALEDQLREQLKAVQDRNAKIAELNKLLTKLNVALKNVEKNGASPDQPIEISDEVLDSLKGNEIEVRGDLTVSELQRLIESVKDSIDEQSNEQQMDMIKLQELTNKRNEAFDTMTDLIKKMQDSRGTIIGNMR